MKDERAVDRAWVVAAAQAHAAANLFHFAVDRIAEKNGSFSGVASQ